MGCHLIHFGLGFVSVAFHCYSCHRMYIYIRTSRFAQAQNPAWGFPIQFFQKPSSTSTTKTSRVEKKGGGQLINSWIDSCQMRCCLKSCHWHASPPDLATLELGTVRNFPTVTSRLENVTFYALRAFTQVLNGILFEAMLQPLLSPQGKLKYHHRTQDIF